MADASTWTGIVQSAIAAASGLLGVLAGSLLTGRNQRIERRNARLREQLQEFYSPMLGMRALILSKSEARQKIRWIAETVWHELFSGVTDPDRKRKIEEEHSPSFDKLQDYNNAQLQEEIIPSYQKMLDHFTTHFWLAERSTQRHYDTLCEFVEIWKRSLDKSLPSRVVSRIQHDEKKLYPFYNDLQDHFDRLRGELKEDNLPLFRRRVPPQTEGAGEGAER